MSKRLPETSKFLVSRKRALVARKEEEKISVMHPGKKPDQREGKQIIIERLRHASSKKS